MSITRVNPTNGVTTEEILLSYLAAFGRAPAVEGFNTWATGTAVTSREVLYGFFMESKEWAIRNSSINTTELIIQMYYKNLFNRDLPLNEPALQWWAADVDNVAKEVNITNVHYVMADAARGDWPDHPGTAWLEMMLGTDGGEPGTEVVDGKLEVAEVITNLDTGKTHMYYDYNQEAWITGTSGLTYSDYELSDITSKSAAAQKIDAITFTPADFETEYSYLYKKLLGQQMGTIDNEDSVLNKLFALIDAEPDVTPREKLSMKKNAYMQMLGNITSSAQQLALQLADKKHKFEGEIKATAANTLKIVNEADLIKTREDVMLQQVIDNRRVKAMDSLGDTFSTGMAGGLVPTASMWNEYFRLSKELTRNELENEELIAYQGPWKPTSETADLPAGEVHDGSNWGTATTSEKAVGHYWIVDLSGWTRDYPTNRLYNEAANATQWVGVDGLDYTVDEEGTTILVTQIGTPKPTNKTDIPGSLCSIPLDGVNYWRHGDIVYVKGITGTATTESTTQSGELVKTGIMVHTYRRIAGLASGTSVIVAPEAATEVNDAAEK